MFMMCPSPTRPLSDPRRLVVVSSSELQIFSSKCSCSSYSVWPSAFRGAPRSPVDVARPRLVSHRGIVLRATNNDVAAPKSEEELVDVFKVSHLSFACGVGCSPFHGHQRPCSESCSSWSIRGHAVSVMQGCTTATSKEELRERLGPTSDAALVAAVQAKVEEKRTKELARAAEIDYKLLHATYSACGVDSPSYLGTYSPTLIHLLWPLCTKANSEEELRRVLKVSHLITVSYASPLHGLQPPCSE